MTLLFYDGFDNVNNGRKPGWTAGGAAQTGRDGAANGGVSWSTGAQTVYTLPTPADTIIYGFAVRYSIVHSQFMLSPKIGTVQQMALLVNSDSKLELRLDSATGPILATGINNFSYDTYHSIQVKATIHLTAGSCVVKMDGITEINYSGQTGRSTGAVTGLGLMHSAYWDWYDDFWVCDAIDATATQGRPNNDFLGDLKCVSIVPSGAGASTQWTPSAGANYAAVDDAYQAPNTSDYVSSVAASAQRDLYDMVDFATTAVYAVAPRYYAQKTDAGSAFIKPLIREPDGTIVEQALKPTLTTWTSLFGTPTFLKSGGSLWTPADLNAIQIGMESA